MFLRSEAAPRMLSMAEAYHSVCRMLHFEINFKINGLMTKNLIAPISKLGSNRKLATPLKRNCQSSPRAIIHLASGV
jgi:hypothetical protein